MLRYCFFTLGLVVMIMVGLIEAASAQILILSSNDPSLKANTELGEAQDLKIGSGKTVRVMLPDGSIRVFNGPVTQPVKELTAGRERLDSLWERVKSLLSGHNTKNTLAGRGVPTTHRALLSWSGVPLPITLEGAICVLEGKSLALWRIDPKAALATGQKSPNAQISPGDQLDENTALTVTWSKPTDVQAEWPSSIRLFDGGHYFIVPNFGDASVVKLRFIDPESINGDKLLVGLHQKQCVDQIEAYFKE